MVLLLLCFLVLLLDPLSKRPLLLAMGLRKYPSRCNYLVRSIFDRSLPMNSTDSVCLNQPELDFRCEALWSDGRIYVDSCLSTSSIIILKRFCFFEIIVLWWILYFLLVIFLMDSSENKNDVARWMVQTYVPSRMIPLRHQYYAVLYTFLVVIFLWKLVVGGLLLF